MASTQARARPAPALSAAAAPRRVSFVIPAFNEEPVIVETIAQLKAMAEAAGLDEWEVVVVDDGSGDATAERAAAGGAETVRHPHNIGYGRALKDGIQAAQHDTIVITDADGTYPIDTVPQLLREFGRGFDMVVGARTGNVYHGSSGKRALRWVLKFLVEFTAGRHVPDVNSGLRVFSRRAVLPYFPHLCETFSFTTSLTLAYMMTGRFVTYVDVPYYARVGETKVRLFRDTLRTLQFIVEAIVYYNPIKIFVLISFLCLVAAALALATGFGFAVLGLVILGVSLVALAILTFCMGLLAVLLKQIMDAGRRGRAE